MLLTCIKQNFGRNCSIVKFCKTFLKKAKVFENSEEVKKYIEETFYNTEVKIIISENDSELEVFSNDKKLDSCIFN